MKIPFYKYQGTGNDFVIIDNRELGLSADDSELVRHLCDRRFGIGGDGLIYLQERDGFDFEMVYFNSDGRQSTMCGNGGRCIIRFAQDMGLGVDDFTFLAIDGPHRGKIRKDGIVSLRMQDVMTSLHRGKDYVLDTGSPHIVHFVKDIKNYPVVLEGRRVRHSDAYKEKGINVNFVEEIAHRNIFVRTYERGVEDETLSCGTGVVASALAYFFHNGLDGTDVDIQTLGGQLNVKFGIREMHFTDIWLTGPAAQVFRGETTI